MTASGLQIIDTVAGTGASPKTGEIVLERQGFFLVRNRLVDGVAPDGTPIPGLWK